MKKFSLLTTFLLVLTSYSFANPTASQMAKGFRAVITHAKANNMILSSIDHIDTHYYDGDLSSLVFEIRFEHGLNFCTQEISVEYPWPDRPKKRAQIDLDGSNEASCKK